MSERDSNIVPFARRGRTKGKGRRVGDSFGKGLTLAMVMIVALAIAAADAFDVKLTLNSWLPTVSSPAATICGPAICN
jgi:hypothetical protein